MTTVLVANPSADLYGSDRMMLEAVRGMVAASWRVVVTCSQDGPLVPLLRDVGAEVRLLRVPVVRKAMLTPRGLVSTALEGCRAVVGMRGLIHDVGPDVLLVNTVTIPLWVGLARALRVPVAVHVHEAEQSLRRPARLALAAPLALADLAVFNSRVSRSVSGLRVLERSGRAVVVLNGVVGPQEVAPPRERLDGSLRVVYVGRLSPRKGVDLVVSAARGLMDRGVDVTVDLVGAVFPGYEWYEDDLRHLARSLDLTDRVRFLGFRSEVWPQLAAADVAVVPSRLDESFGNTVVEALLAARPVVVSDHTGLREASEGFGAVILIPRDDVDALVEALEHVREEWRDVREQATKDAGSARRRYAPSRFHGQLMDALSGLTGQNESRRTVAAVTS